MIDLQASTPIPETTYNAGLEAIEYTLEGQSYRGIARGDVDAPIVIALHGWLDNAASFAPLMSHLTDYRLIALDMPGHGYSAHWRSGLGYSYPYQYSDMVMWVQGMIEAVMIAHSRAGEQPYLLGHSLGGTVATMYAGALSERIKALLLIESFGPFTAADDALPLEMRRSVRLQLRSRENPSGNLRTFPDIEAAIARRMSNKNAGGELGRAAATLLVNRGLQSRNGGYQWRTDPMLMLPSPVRFVESQVVATIQKIKAPTLLLEGDDGLLLKMPNRGERLAAFKQLTHEYRAGRHHLHMENAVESAEVINAFLANS